MYEYADKAVKYLNKKFASYFGFVIPADELNTLNKVNATYRKSDEITRKMLLLVAKDKYRRLTEKWLNEAVLSVYDEVLRYSYENETDRKRARLFEALVAAPNKVEKKKEIKKALRYWAAMVAQYTITTADKANIQRMKDSGVKKVQWITAEDDRVCAVCEARDKKIYDIDKIPSKPHIGCRCYVKEVGE